MLFIVIGLSPVAELEQLDTASSPRLAGNGGASVYLSHGLEPVSN